MTDIAAAIWGPVIFATLVQERRRQRDVPMPKNTSDCLTEKLHTINKIHDSYSSVIKNKNEEIIMLRSTIASIVIGSTIIVGGSLLYNYWYDTESKK